MLARRLFVDALKFWNMQAKEIILNFNSAAAQSQSSMIKFCGVVV